MEIKKTLIGRARHTNRKDTIFTKTYFVSPLSSSTNSIHCTVREKEQKL
jgi:hypothetical protein